MKRKKIKKLLVNSNTKKKETGLVSSGTKKLKKVFKKDVILEVEKHKGVYRVEEIHSDTYQEELQKILPTPEVFNKLQKKEQKSINSVLKTLFQKERTYKKIVKVTSLYKKHTRDIFSSELTIFVNHMEEMFNLDDTARSILLYIFGKILESITKYLGVGVDFDEQDLINDLK